MRPLILSCVLVLVSLSSQPALAQGWVWGETGPRYRGYNDNRYSRVDPWSYEEPRRAPRYQQPGFFPWDQPRSSERDWEDDDSVLEGGARPAIAPIPPEVVPFPNSYARNSIIIDTHGKQLYLVRSERDAYRYPISVGREGFTWTGTEKISRIADWPDWYPPKEMRERDPRLPVKMTGGLRNPLGAKALYLGNTLYRIHGTNDAKTIGQAASSGCFRMLNGHVMDLASRVSVGTPVTVVDRLPPEIARAVPPPRLPGQPSEQARMRRWQ